jgi:hypothetical protein
MMQPKRVALPFKIDRAQPIEMPMYDPALVDRRPVERLIKIVDVAEIISRAVIPATFAI